MKILTTHQIREADEYTITHEPISSIDLMERAASSFTDKLKSEFPKQRKYSIFVGPGNNGGDGLVIARLLAFSSIDVQLIYVKFGQESKDFNVNFHRLDETDVSVTIVEDDEVFPIIDNDRVVIDAIFGTGLSRPVEGFPAKGIEYINSLENIVVSVDIPSGLFGDNNSNNYFKTIVKADYTITFEVYKLAFLYQENVDYLGKQIIIPIGLHHEFIEELDSPYHILSDDLANQTIKVRTRASHKGTYGHALLVAGGYGKMGAAVLATKACLRSGIGLLTTHIPKLGYEIMQISIPEAMLSVDKYDKVLSKVPIIDNFTCIGIGPGIGKSRHSQLAFLELLNKVKTPMVIDADAINILSENKEWINKIPENSILTPHKKEFERLVGEVDDDYSRNKVQIEFSQKHNVYVVLKSTFTSISCPDGNCFYNMNGNPGMSTAGSGDVLTGIILGLLAQNYTPKEAATLGVFVHGLAGDIAGRKMGYESLIASDIINYLPNAFKKIQKRKTGK